MHLTFNSPPPSIQQHRQPQSNPNDYLPPHNLPSPTLSSSLVNRDMPPAAFLSASSSALVVRRLPPTHALQLLRLVRRRRDGRVEDRRVGVVSLLSFSRESGMLVVSGRACDSVGAGWASSVCVGRQKPEPTMVRRVKMK
ncbi:hypothetical protein NXS19_007881 [Fusarium pseudograminearum]|nr:hypothetical protein NXS19_007881 [Fusarium pseudograminearum]